MLWPNASYDFIEQAIQRIKQTSVAEVSVIDAHNNQAVAVQT